MIEFITDIIHLFNAEILSVLPDEGEEDMFLLITDVYLDCQDCHAKAKYTFKHQDQIDLSNMRETANYPRCEKCHSTNVVVDIYEYDMKEEVDSDIEDASKAKKTKRGTNGRPQKKYQKDELNTLEERIMSLRQRVAIEEMYMQRSDMAC